MAIGAAQAVADRRRAGEQGERPRRAVGVAGPQDLAPRRLQVEHEVDGPLDHGPHRLDEALVAVQQPVVPHAGGDVGAHVGVELVLLDAVGQVVLVPGAVGPLQVDEPLVGPLGLGAAAAEVEGHGRLDVVPRVGVPAGEPRDHARRQLPLGDAVDGGVRGRSAVTRPGTSMGIGVSACPRRACGRTRPGSCRGRG